MSNHNTNVAVFGPRFVLSKEPPTVSGWYWFRPQLGVPMIALVYHDDGEGGALKFDSPGAYGCMITYKVADMDWFEWAGPIPKPDERKEDEQGTISGGEH